MQFNYISEGGEWSIKKQKEWVCKAWGRGDMYHQVFGSYLNPSQQGGWAYYDLNYAHPILMSPTNFKSQRSQEEFTFIQIGSVHNVQRRMLKVSKKSKISALSMHHTQEIIPFIFRQFAFQFFCPSTFLTATTIQGRHLFFLICDKLHLGWKLQIWFYSKEQHSTPALIGHTPLLGQF